MKKITIAVIFGGCSPEHEVSLSSASAILREMDRQKYEPVMIGITKEGCWFYFEGPVSSIENGTWMEDKKCYPAVISPDRVSHKLLIMEPEGIREIKFDAAFPVLHGKNGEDGTVQGLLEAAGIPVIGCGTLSSALCMDKDKAHRLAALQGILVPLSFVFSRNELYENGILKMKSAALLQNRADRLKYPLFIKPVKAGSSFGVTKVSEEDKLIPAVEEAFLYDCEIIMEEAIDGFEVGCAVMGNEELTVGDVDEIELNEGFFDYTEKYTLKTSSIYVPARIPEEKAEEIKEAAKIIYKALGCRCFARVDLFLKSNGRIVFNEVNTIPGFTSHSRFPGMLFSSGMTFPDMIDRVVTLSMDQIKENQEV